MGNTKAPAPAPSVTITLSVAHAKTLLTALTHAIHGGGLKGKSAAKKGPKPK
jgi:hypothetical protein